MKTPVSAAQPRKKPVQTRSQATVDAIHEATIQILVAEGVNRCNTTRVAERAGVSVGSLYQYYPNRHALLTAILELHIERVTNAIESACAAHCGRPLADMAAALAIGFLNAKIEQPETARALYPVFETHGGPEMLRRMRAASVRAIARMLDSASDARFDDAETVGGLVLSAITGPVKQYLEGDTTEAFRLGLRRHLVDLATAYLQRVAHPREAAAPVRMRVGA